MTFSEFIEKLRRGEFPARKMGEQPPWMEPTPNIIRAKPDSPIAVPLESVQKAYVDDRPPVLATHKPELSMSDITMPINKPSTTEVAACVPKPKWIEPAHYMSFELERWKKKMSNIPKIPFTYTTVNGGTPTFAATFKLEDLYTSMHYVKDTWPDAEMRLFGIPFVTVPAIDDVIFNGPATIVMWADGDKTVVKCQGGDNYSKETGLAMAISKKALGNKGRFNEVFKKWIPGYGEDKGEESEAVRLYEYNFTMLLSRYENVYYRRYELATVADLSACILPVCPYIPSGKEVKRVVLDNWSNENIILRTAQSVLNDAGKLPKELRLEDRPNADNQM